uniref:Uncharacterized protein LOC112814329 isoform X1 n=1 Tax=Callorhinus ursinus TaxID=34884 RepID=A0A3Q7N6W1_CALUR|nr:uncharacterized protein LOC112814329 isoform X1 [Callorhinus ursinus]
MLSSSFVWEDRGAQGILPFTHCHPLLRILWAPDVLIWKKAWCRPQGSRTDGKVMAAVPGGKPEAVCGAWSCSVGFLWSSAQGCRGHHLLHLLKEGLGIGEGKCHVQVLLLQPVLWLPQAQIRVGDGAAPTLTSFSRGWKTSPNEAEDRGCPGSEMSLLPEARSSEAPAGPGKFGMKAARTAAATPSSPGWSLGVAHLHPRPLPWGSDEVIRVTPTASALPELPPSFHVDPETCARGRARTPLLTQRGANPLHRPHPWSQAFKGWAGSGWGQAEQLGLGNCGTG